MPDDTATLQRDLERMRTKNDSLTTDLNMALQSSKAGPYTRPLLSLT